MKLIRLNKKRVNQLKKFLVHFMAGFHEYIPYESIQIILLHKKLILLRFKNYNHTIELRITLQVETFRSISPHCTHFICREGKKINLYTKNRGKLIIINFKNLGSDKCLISASRKKTLVGLRFSRTPCQGLPAVKSDSS